MNSTITIYGADWCADCKRAKSLLDSKGISYDYINIDTVDGATDKMLEINGGFKRIPTIVFDDKSFLIEPSNAELISKIKQLQ